MAKEIVYFRLPLQYNGVTQKYSTKHRAIDLGWNSRYGGRKAPVYSISRAQVSRIRASAASGNILELRYNYDDCTWIQQYYHLSAIHVKVGQKVNMGEHIANMGDTGTAATAPHLHFALYKCPLGTQVPQTKWAVNPLDYTYAYDDQLIAAGSSSVIKKRVYGLPYWVQGNVPELVDKSKKQIRVTGVMNCRDGAHGSVLGYAVNGIYTVLNEHKLKPYTWYQIGSKRWIANVKGKVTEL